MHQHIVLKLENKMRYLKNIWKMKNNSSAGQKKSLGSDRTFNNESSSENEFSSTDKRASFTSLLGLNRKISSDSEDSSCSSRTFLFSDPSLGKDANSDVKKYNRHGISPLELDQSLNMRAYRMSMYVL